MSYNLFCKFCTLVFFSILVVVQGQDGEITYDGPPYVMVGGSFNITCRVFGELEWHKDGKPINAIRANGYVEPKERKQGSFTISTLTVSEVKESHAGAYKCNSLSNHIIYINITRRNAQAMAQSADDPKKPVIFASENPVLTVGKNLDLFCNVSDRPDLNFTWYFGNTVLNYSTDQSDKHSKYYYSKEKNIFTIKHTKINDTGTYKCVVNIESTDHSKTIEVWGKPWFSNTHMQHSYNKVEGDSITLNCTAEARPEPFVYWAKETGDLSENDRIKIINGSQFAEMTIENLETTDRDNYICFAVNNVSTDTNFTVLIRVKDKLAALWPFLGICAEVAILCTIIFIYEKRRSKEEMEEEPQHEEKSVSNSNQKDKDIRQRK